MKKLIILFCLLTTISYSQVTSYVCRDINNKEFNIVITDGTYNIIIDSFRIVTTLDTIIQGDYYCKYVPCSNLRDTMTIYNSNFISFSTKSPTTFIILRKMTAEESSIIFNRRYMILSSE